MNEWPVFVKLWDVAALAALDAVAGLGNTPEGSILRGEAAATQHRDAPYIAPLLWGKIFEISQGGGGGSTDELQQDGQEISTEIQGQNPEDVRVVLVDEKNQKEMPSHIFEKVETADEYRGEQRHTDGDDELDEHLTALEELDLNSMYRGGAPASSLYKADIRLHLDIPDVHSVSASERAIQYDEWDARKGRYKQNWVSVYPTSLPVVANSYAQRIADEKRGQITHLTRRLKNYRQNLRPQRRQFDGEDVDIDALIQETAASTAGHGGNTRMYERRVRSTRSIATTVLLDISLSADSWVQNRRVLDVAREAIVVLGEVTNTLGDDLQILAFGSNTRNLVRVFSLKDWSESWARARHRLGSVTPQGYTRIGPALRHATADILKRPANRRMVLLLSDGKPTDYDRYEGNYGIKDVRQAVREANGNGVHVFGFAIDQLARNYLPAMLGEHNWTMMPLADALSDGLTDIYGRATK
ncbi:MAG: VWA domain-containing protein [bacterium]